MMKIVRSKFVLPTAILAIVFFSASVFFSAGRAEVEHAAAFSRQPLQAKLEYCKTCHGLSGQGYRGFFPIPRLAGQQPEYIVNQLRAFTERRRENQYMYSVAHALHPAMLTALAAHFKDLNPKPLGDAPRKLVATGKKIYEEGIPEANVPACMACHGGEAKGQGAIPRLAGQLHDYIFNKLVNWTKERGRNSASPDTSAIMVATSHSLTKPQIAAIAAYVSYLQ